MQDEFYVYGQWSYLKSGVSLNRIKGDGSVEVLQGIMIPKEVQRQNIGARSPFLTELEALIPELEKRGDVHIIDAEMDKTRHFLSTIPSIIVERDGVPIYRHDVREADDLSPAVLDGPLSEASIGKLAKSALDAIAEGDSRKKRIAKAREWALIQRKRIQDGETMSEEQVQQALYLLLSLVLDEIPELEE